MKLYKQAFSLGLQKAMRYRVNFWLEILSFSFPLCIQFFLWTSVFASSENKIIFGYTLGQMLAYAVFAAITSKLVSVSFVGEVNMEIKQGGFAKYLVRPVRYIPYQGACFLGEKIMNILFATIIMILLSIIFHYVYPIELTMIGFIFYYVSLLLAIVLNYLLFICFCGAGFWMKDGSGAIFIMTLVGNIVSGGIFPLDIFSWKVQFFLKLLPFSYTTYFPASIISGNLQPAEMLRGFLLQLVWIGVMGGISSLVWRQGVKRYTAVGG